jgi:hypothetical protein
VRLALQCDKEAGDYLVPSAIGFALKPDLADFDSREVWEVKPHGGESGLPQLHLYLSLLDTAEREYLALSRHHRYRSANPLAPAGQPRRWRPGSSWPIDDFETIVAGKCAALHFEFVEPGVIQWHLA